MSDLKIDQARRDEALISASIQAHIERRLSGLELAAPISPSAKRKLGGILRKYAKSPHPFRACVRDNIKRFGPGRTEAICATLKDEIRGRKDWRKGGVAASDGVVIDGDVLMALDAISDVDLEAVFMEARALEEGVTREALGLSVTGADELRRWGDGMALEER